MFLEYHALLLVAGLLEVIILLFCPNSKSPFLTQYQSPTLGPYLPSLADNFPKISILL